MREDATRILAILDERRTRGQVREHEDLTSIRLCPDAVQTSCALKERKSNTFPRRAHSKKCGLRQRKLSLTVEQEMGILQDYSNPATPRTPKGQKVKTYFEVDFEDSTCEEELDLEELKRILLSFSLQKESFVENDGFLTTTLCSTEL